MRSPSLLSLLSAEQSCSGGGILLFNLLVEPLYASLCPRLHLRQILGESNPVRVGALSDRPALEITFRGRPECFCIPIDQGLNRFGGEGAGAKLFPAGGEFSGIRRMAKQSVEEMVGQPEGGRHGTGIPIPAEGAVVIPWNEKETRFGAWRCPVTCDHEILVNSIEIAGEQDEQMEINRVIQIQSRGNAGLRVEEGSVGTGADKFIESIEWT